MSDDLVRAEIRSVQALRHGVGRYAEHIRDTGAQARREMASAVQRTQESVERRRKELERRERDLRQARNALAECHKECEALRRQAHEAGQLHDEARMLLDRARRAAQAVAHAEADLFKVLRHVEAKVAETSSVAASALAELDAKLDALPLVGRASRVQNVVVTAATVLNIAVGVPDAAHLVGNSGAAFGVDIDLANSSLQEYREDQRAQELGYVAEIMSKRANPRLVGDEREGGGDS